MNMLLNLWRGYQIATSFMCELLGWVLVLGNQSVIINGIEFLPDLWRTRK